MEKMIIKCLNFMKKRVLITGHSGFKGSWLSIWLLKMGSEICGFSNGVPTQPSNFETVKIKKKIKNYNGDVRDINKLKKVFKDFKPEIIFHLAAQSLVRKSFKEPLPTFETNVRAFKCLKPLEPPPLLKLQL